MNLGLDSLMTASGMGMGAGLLKQVATIAFQSWRASRQEKIEREEKRDALIKENGAEFQKTLNEKPVIVDTDNEGSFNIQLWFITFGWDWKSKGHDVAKNDARSSRSSIVWMLCLTICIVTIIFAGNPLTPVWTTPADVEPSTRELFWGAISWSSYKQSVQVLSGLGCAFLMVHAMLGVLNFWLVQVPINYVRGRR